MLRITALLTYLSKDAKEYKPHYPKNDVPNEEVGDSKEEWDEINEGCDS